MPITPSSEPVAETPEGTCALCGAIGATTPRNIVVQREGARIQPIGELSRRAIIDRTGVRHLCAACSAELDASQRRAQNAVGLFAAFGLGSMILFALFGVAFFGAIATAVWWFLVHAR